MINDITLSLYVYSVQSTVTFIQFSIFRLVENLFRGPKFHDILDQIDNSEYISNCTILNLKQSDKAKARTNLISKIPTSKTSCCGSVIITSSTSDNCLMWTMITLDLIVDNYVWIMYSINFKRKYWCFLLLIFFPVFSIRKCTSFNCMLLHN